MVWFHKNRFPSPKFYSPKHLLKHIRKQTEINSTIIGVDGVLWYLVYWSESDSTKSPKQLRCVGLRNFFSQTSWQAGERKSNTKTFCGLSNRSFLEILIVNEINWKETSYKSKYCDHHRSTWKADASRPWSFIVIDRRIKDGFDTVFQPPNLSNLEEKVNKYWVDRQHPENKIQN